MAINEVELLLMLAIVAGSAIGGRLAHSAFWTGAAAVGIALLAGRLAQAAMGIDNVVVLIVSVLVIACVIASALKMSAIQISASIAGSVVMFTAGVIVLRTAGITVAG